MSAVWSLAKWHLLLVPTGTAGCCHRRKPVVDFLSNSQVLKGQDVSLLTGLRSADLDALLRRLISSCMNRR